MTGADWTGRWRPMLRGGAAMLLLAPLLAMQLTPEVNWSGGDFLVFGALLLLACAAVEAAVRFAHTRTARTLAILAIGALFLLTWAELAVGIFGPG